MPDGRSQLPPQCAKLTLQRLYVTPRTIGDRVAVASYLKTKSILGCEPLWQVVPDWRETGHVRRANRHQPIAMSTLRHRNSIWRQPTYVVTPTLYIIQITSHTQAKYLSQHGYALFILAFLSIVKTKDWSEIVKARIAGRTT